ncbi:hypothetical protein BsWGS_27026 [Bradybaena similaris]
MTSRGNQSVSPPAQISQQRHVNAIPSSTPPPQQYYQGAPSTLSQGAYEFLPQAQGHPFNPYQAYGSSLSDTRAQPGNSGRGVPTQANLTQGNNYYQQPGPNIRPQQSHTYYITAQPQGNMRHPRPSPQSQMMFIAPNFTPANSVITVPANMYPSARVPMYPPTNFVPGAAPYPNIVYYQNGTPTWPRPAIPPAAASAPRPVQREKKVLSIMDPDTGRDITEELLNSRSHSVGAEEHHDELSTVNQNDKEICQTFTRLVADRLKSPDDSSTSAAASDSQASVASATISSTAAAPSSQQYQPPLPQQHTQQQQPSSIAAATAMRPPAAVPHTIPATHSGMPQQTSATHSGMPQQTPAIAAHSHDTQHQVLSLNLSMPPPQYPLRQPTPTVYAPVSQQHQHPAAHHAPRHTHSSQPQQQQPIRAPGVPVIHPPPQQTTNQLPQPQYQPPQPVHPPVNTAIDPVPQPLTVEPCVTDKQTPLVEATSQDNIPAKPAGPASSSTVAPATVTSALPQMVEDADIKASSVKQAIIEEASIIDRAGDNGKVDASQGVISQGMKDGRKGKKGKKDFSRREIGGSDMDAFIDSIESKQVTKSNPVKTKTESDSASLSNIGRGSETMATAKNVVKRDPKNPWNIQSAADTTTKRDTHNPWAVRGQEPAQAKLSVSISPATQGRSRERPNPWRILPVNALETNPDVTNNTASDASSEPHGATDTNKLAIGTQGFQEPSVKATASSCNTITTAESVLTVAQKSKGTCEPGQMQGTKTNLPQKMPSHRAVSFKRSTTLKPLVASSTTAPGGLRLSTSLFENPWHRKLPASLLSSDSGKQEERTVVNGNTKKCLPVARQNDLSSCVSSTASSVFENGNAEVDFRLQKNIKSLTPVVGLVCKVKSASLPRPDVTAFVVAVGPSHCGGASQSTIVQSQCPEVQKPQSKGTDNQSTNKSKSHELCISVAASPANTRGQGSLDSGAVLAEPNSQLKFQKVDGASSGSGENTRSGSGENTTRTNNALDVAPVAGSSGATVHHSGQKVADVAKAIPVVSSGAPESGDLNTQRHVSTAQASDIPLDGDPPREDSPSTHKTAETQKQTAPAQVESKHKQKKKKQKKGRKTPPNQKVKPCSSSSKNSEVQSEVVEVDDKHPQCQPVTECKYVDKPAGGDIKPSSASIALSQESSSVRVAKLTETSSVAKAPEPSCVAMAPEPSSAAKVPESSIVVKVPEPSSVTKLPEPSSMAKMPVRTVTPVPPPEDTEKKASLPTATYISAPIKNQNQPQAEQTGHTFESSRVAQGPTDRHSSKPFENGIADFHAEPLPTISIDAASDLPKSNYPFIDESESSELVRRQKNIDVKKGQTLGSSSSSASRQSSEKTMTPAKKDAKDKLQYDRAYLMELRECSTSQTKPEGLPNLEIILDRPVMGGSRGSSTAPLDFTPTFFQQTAGNQRPPVLQHAPPIGKTNSRNRSRTDVQMPQRIIKSVSLQDSVKPLHQCDKPWKPTPKVLSTGEKVERTLESKVLGIMNKLTPTTFEKLAGEMMKLNISTYSELQELVKIFFDKVTMETKFVGSYAILCKLMAGLRVPPPPNSAIRENQATFRVVMLTKCQQEFEADKTVVFEDPEEKRRKIEAEMPDGPERAEKIENTLYQMKLKRLKFYGNIRFIGELYKLNMLTETIMHDCILRLLKARDDDSLVSLCNLITTVGQSLDSDKARTRMDQYFAQMAKIADERKSRIKFTLKDVIDLRSNGWTPRKEQTGPKKLEEVHKDYQEEQATKQFLQNQPLPPRNDPQPSSRRGSRQRQDENKPTDDGWNTVGSKSLRIDASKMKLSKNVVDEDNIKLGPGGGMKQFSMWSRGSGAQPSQDERQSGPSNRFSALRGEEERRNYQRSPSRGDSNSLPNRNMRQGPSAGHGRGKIMARSSQEGDRRDALASARSIVGGRSQNSSRDNSWNREDRRHTLAPRGSREGENVMTRSDISLQPNREPFLVPTVPAPVSTAAPAPDAAGMKKIKPLSESEMEFKAKTILDEYLSVLDLEEAKLCLRELTGQQHLHLLVTACVNEVLERSTKDRAHTGQFFHEMVKHGLLPMDIYLKGLADVLQYAEDIVIDIPMMWSYLAQIILPMLIGGSLQWASLPDVLKPYLGGKGSAILVVEILLQAREKVGEDEVTLMWQTSGLTWTAFLPAEEVDRFLKDKRLEFTVGQVAPSAARVPVYGQLDSQKFIEDISNILRERGTSSEICAYVEANVRADKQDRHFIRSLVTAMVNASISTHTMKFNEDIVKTHKDVLQRYIKSNPDLELQALYAIQALMHKLEHPSGVIANIFDVLYDEEVISEEAFKQWEKSSDVLEVEGKGACSMQLTQFFTWLRENEEFEAS